MVILFLAWLFLQTSYGQNKALPIALNYLSTTLGTEIKASHIDISFFDEIQLDDVIALDSEGDTLIYIEKLDGDIGLFSFMNKTLDIDKLYLKGAQINLKETSNGTFNYSHIISHLVSPEEKDENDLSNPWNINLDALELEDTQIEYSSIGSEIHMTIPKLKGDLKVFSILESIFHFNTFSTEGILFSYEETDIVHIIEGQEPTMIPSLPFTLIIDDISVSSNGLSYNTNDPLVASPPFDPNHISINNLELEGNNLTWTDSISFDLKKLNAVFSDGFEITNLKTELLLSNQSTFLENTHIQTLNSDIVFSGSSIYNDFDSFINDFQNGISTLEFQESTISKDDITYFIDEKLISDVNVNSLNKIQLKGSIALNKGKLDAKNFSLKSGSEFNILGSFSTSNISSINSSAISFDISKLSTSQSFIERLFPTVKLPNDLNNLGSLNGNLKGKFNQKELSFKKINLITGIGTTISGNGRVYAIQDDKGPEFELNLTELTTNLNSLLSDKLSLPEELQRLENIKYSGLIKGNFNNIEAKGNLSTSLGNVDLDTKIKFNDDYSDAIYNGYLKTQDFDLGTMLNDTTFGIVNFEGNIKGSGLEFDKLETTVDGKISSIYYDGKTYNDISLDGAYKNKIFEGKIASKDKNLNFDINGKIDLSSSTSAMDVTMEMKNIDLKELGFSDSLMILGGVFQGKVNGNSIDEILGEGSIANFSVRTQKGSYTADSTIYLKAAKMNEIAKVFSIDSPFLDAEIKGKIKPSILYRYIKNYIKAYIPLEIGYDEDIEDNLEKYFEVNEDQNFIFSAKTKDINPVLIPFIGNKISINSASIGAYFSSQETRLDIKGKIDSLIYNGILLQRGSYFFDGRKAFINGNINLENISMDDEILIPLTTINTSLNNKVADFNIVMANEEDVERLNLSGDMTRTDEYIVTFKDSILLNGFNWKFSPYNQVIFGDYGFYMQDVKLSKEKQAITIYTDENENGEAIEVLFDDFILSELTAIIDKENEYFEGKINGSLVINSLFSKPFITADLGLKNITIAGNEAGNLTIEAAQDLASNSVKSTVRLSGPQNDATLKLDYGIQNQSTEGELDIGKLEMAIIDPYLTDIFINSEGYVNGKIEIKGDLNNLDLKGKLRTHDIVTTPVFTNSRYAIMDSDITFTNSEIDFGTFELKDKNSHSAFVTGKIYHRNLRNSVIDLKVNTDNFEFLNTTKNENELFYGNVNISGNITVNGPIDDIEIDGSVDAVNSSYLSVSPLSLEKELLSDDFIIYSGDPRKIPSDSLQLEATSTKIALPFDVDLKVNVKEDSEFSMILNPITGDKLICNGTTNLTLKLKKNGEMELFGLYTVSKGVYTFSYGPITKEFIIQPGSTVTFNGDPLKGTLNVDAIYVANTGVYDLIKLEIPDLDDAKKSEAQRKRDMNVVLSLTESLEKPEIKLDITTNENELSSTIDDILIPKLAQLRENPDELNNQVFGLLLFDNFILAKNAETDLAKTGTDLVIRSISGLVGQQLNKLADGLIEGFEVNFDVNSYSSDLLSTGQEGVITEFGFGVKKSLFDDRLSLSVGTNINLESSSKQLDFGSIVGDFILGYKLNKDGSWRFKAYSKSSVDKLSAAGNSAKNGIGLFVRKEFGEVKKNKN